MNNRSDLAVTRVRHPLKFRLLQVKHVRRLTPHLTRVTLTGDDLHDFESASFDDHVKVFFPAPGADKPALPQAGPTARLSRPASRVRSRAISRRAALTSRRASSTSSSRCTKPAPLPNGPRRQRPGNTSASAGRAARW
jgi:NADPH-dependent ferric siderophore reductase